jgi:hypothetical protein
VGNLNLIIAAELSSDPPSEGLYFRFITMVAKTDLNYEVVIESEKEMVDNYYNFLKKKGWYDFVDDIILPEWRVEGVRIDTENNYPLTIKTPYIRCENTPNLLGQINSIRDFV